MLRACAALIVVVMLICPGEELRAQSLPDCKSIFPDFQTTEALNKLPGTITDAEVEEKLDQIDALHPTPKQLEATKASIESTRAMLPKMRAEIDNMTKRRDILERLVAQSLNLIKDIPAETGSTAFLYCENVSQLSVANYEIQQDTNYYQIAVRIVKNADNWK